ncbi:hypothetical protein AAGQ96_12860 [Pantoea sp. MBD-2R]|uniref:hypothetical protein n=1 Tax=Pantoea sp. MBD-2R TaxID=3141540 RepID=UPI003182FA49
MNPIKWLLTKAEPQSKEAPVTDTVTDTTATAEPVVGTTTVQPTVTQTTAVSTDNTDAVLARLKKLVEAAGAQAHAVIDDLIALAKKLG